MEEVRSSLPIAAYLAASPAFQALDVAICQDLAEELEELHLQEGDILFDLDDPRDAAYLVMSGRIELLTHTPDGAGLPSHVLAGGFVAGDSTLAGGMLHRTCARALEETRVLRLSRAGLERLCEKYPEAVAVLPPGILPAASQTVLAGVIADLLGELDATQVRALLAEMPIQRLTRGDILTRQGEAADRMFVVIYGRLRIVRDYDGTEIVVDEAGRGETIGERSLLTGDVRSTTVFALRDSAVGVITRDVFENMKRRYPDVMTRLARIALRRVERRAATPSAFHAADAVGFAVFPVGVTPGGVPLAAFAERLASTLSAYGSVLHVSSARVEARLGSPGIAQVHPGEPCESRLATWLQCQEESHSYMVYEADPVPSAWTERCLRMADRVLLLGDGARVPLPGALDEFLERESDATGTELVLLQPDRDARPSGTAAWLDRYPAAAHHHVRLGRQADLESLVRRVTGRGLGLVLGGGGARGFAHIGVFRALREYGVAVDLVGGTSMGAILSATFAMGLDYDAHMVLARQLASPLKLFDPTMPVVSFFASGKVTRVLERIYGDTQIEDLWMPCFCVSSNLTHAVPMVHRRGPLWQAVRASMAIPGVFSPILADGDLLVDGCVLNNLPIDVMQRMNLDGPIIAVNVFPDVDLVRDYHFGPSISGWQALVGKLNPMHRRDSSAPLIFESLIRVLALNDVHQAKGKRGFTDVYIRPPVEQYNILDFGAYASITEIGYQSAMETLAGWEGLPARDSEATARAGSDEATLAAVKNADARPTRWSAITADLQRTLDELDVLLEHL